MSFYIFIYFCTQPLYYHSRELHVPICMQVSDNWTKRLHAMPGYSPYEIGILRVSTCVEIALRCVDNDREKRPCIEDIVHKLGELEARIKTIMLLPHDHRRGLLTNLGPVPYFPKHIRLYMSHNLAQDGAVTGYKSNRLRLDSRSGPTSTTHGRKSEDPSLQVRNLSIYKLKSCIDSMLLWRPVQLIINILLCTNLLHSELFRTS